MFRSILWCSSKASQLIVNHFQGFATIRHICHSLSYVLTFLLSPTTSAAVVSFNTFSCCSGGETRGTRGVSLPAVALSTVRVDQMGRCSRDTFNKSSNSILSLMVVVTAPVALALWNPNETVYTCRRQNEKNQREPHMPVRQQWVPKKKCSPRKSNISVVFRCIM